MYINMCVYIPICTCKYTVCIYIYTVLQTIFHTGFNISCSQINQKKTRGGVFTHCCLKYYFFSFQVSSESQDESLMNRLASALLWHSKPTPLQLPGSSIPCFGRNALDFRWGKSFLWEKNRS